MTPHVHVAVRTFLQAVRLDHRAAPAAGFNPRLGTLLRAAAFVAALIVSALLLVAPATAAERITAYDIEIEVHADGSLDVVEHITVHAAGGQIRRGIYRDFPTRYKDRFGNRVVVGFEVLGVERDGRPEPWFTERIGNGVRINTGGDDFLPDLPANYRFTLRYRTTRQLGFFDEHDELYWNAIGTGWVFPIEAATVVARLPAAVALEDMAIEAYTGPQGATGRDYRAEAEAPGVARWELTRTLAPYEGLTIVLGFPKGLVAEPGGAQRLIWLLRDNVGVLVASAGLLLLLVFTIWRWHRVGRDPQAGTRIARYAPPEGYSPGELRYLLRGKSDMRCVTSDLLALAVADHIRLECEPRMLFRDKWRIYRGPRAAEPPEHPSARTLLHALLPPGTAQLELNRRNTSVLQDAVRKHQRALDERMHGKYFKRNAGSTVIAFAITIATGFFAVVLSQDTAGFGLTLALCALMVLISLVFAKLVKAPTDEGRRLLDAIEGLKLYLRVAERDELKRLEHEAAPALDAVRYQQLLPYAIALDVEQAWTHKFTHAVGAAAAATATAGFTWYQGGRVSNLGNFSKAVSSGLNASLASASTPSSSGSPGSSSGGGGGGSSGGGGGGGGGGGR